MGKKMEISSEIENIIIRRYIDGKSSTIISKEIGISKPIIYNILHKNELIKKRNRCESLVIEQDENGRYFIMWECPGCHTLYKKTAQEKIYLCRNYFKAINNKTLCKKCAFIGEKNPFFGKKHSKESISAISKSREGKGTGENNSMANPEHKEKARQKLIESWNSGNLEETRKRMSEVMKNTRLEGKLKSVIKSKKEDEIKIFLEKLDFEVISSYRIDSKVCDIYIPSLNLIIEYFGDYWHANPIKYKPDYFNGKKNQTAQQIWDYDKNKIDLIKSYDYNLEIIWERDLKIDYKPLENILEKYVRKYNNSTK